MQEIRRAGYILIGIMALAMTCSFVWRPAPPPRFHGLAELGVPGVIAGYTGKDVQVDALTKGALVSADIMSRSYDGPGSPINLTIIGGTNRSALHDPRSCLVGAGWKISDDRVETLPEYPAVRLRSCEAELADTTGSNTDIDMMYLYVSHGHIISSATEIRMALLEALLFDQSDSPVYFIRFTTPVSPNSDGNAEHAQLVSFAESLWKTIGPKVLDGGHR